jgi:hypothetical protein
VNVTRKVKSLKDEAVAKASLNRAKSVWYSDVKRDDLPLARMKLR